jgi:hypothetical protein
MISKGDRQRGASTEPWRARSMESSRSVASATGGFVTRASLGHVLVESRWQGHTECMSPWINVLLVSVGALFWGTCAYQVYDHYANMQTWIVSVPESALVEAEDAARIEATLSSRVKGTSPQVSYQGQGKFAVTLSAEPESAAWLEDVLSEPGAELSLREVSGDDATCDDSARAVVGPGSLDDARVDLDRQGKPVLVVALNAYGGQALREYTRQHVGERMAVCLDGELLSAPYINDVIGRNFQMSSGKSLNEVNRLAQMLRSGTLPVGVTARRAADSESAP